MKNILLSSLIFCSYLVISVLSKPVFAEGEIDKAIDKGRAEFLESCSLCHGENAKGHGVFSTMLTVETADLTTLKKNNHGIFPYRNVYLTIDGRDEIKQHGPRHMPIWGDRFQSNSWFSVSDQHADTLVRGKIFEIILFLDSIQE